MAQPEDAKKFEEDKFPLHVTIMWKKVGIWYGKTVCPNYDASNPFWIAVNELATKTSGVKIKVMQVMQDHENNKKYASKSTLLANSILHKVQGDDVIVLKQTLSVPLHESMSSLVSISALSSSPSKVSSKNSSNTENKTTLIS